MYGEEVPSTRSSRHSSAAVAVCFALVFTAAAQGQVPADAIPADKHKIQWMRKYYRQVAEGHKVHASHEPAVTLKLQETPVIYWISLKGFNGTGFVWTHGGRPEVVGSIFSWPTANPSQRRVKADFYSFSARPLTITSPTGRRWEAAPLAALSALTDAAEPTATPRRRQRQIRALAQRFSAHMNARPALATPAAASTALDVRRQFARGAQWNPVRVRRDHNRPGDSRAYRSAPHTGGSQMVLSPGTLLR